MSVSEIKSINNIQKLKLLLWKNTRLQLTHKIQTVCIIAIPILISLLLLPLRAVLPKDPILIPEKKFISFDVTLTNITIGEIFYSPQNKILDAIIKDVVTNLNAKGSKAFKNLDELERELKKQDGFVGIEFEDSLASIDKLPSTIRIALRFPRNLRSQEAKAWGTNEFYVTDMKLFYQIQSPNNSYVAEGFLAVQATLSNALLLYKSSDKKPTLPQISMQRYPEHKYLNFDLIKTVIGLAKSILIVAYMYPASTVTKAILQEKENQLKEIMRIMGISNWLHWLAWFIKSFVLLGIPAIIIAILWSALAKLSVFYYSSSFLIILVFAVYITNIICFSFMISAFFSRALWGSIVCVVAYGVTMVPAALVPDVTNLSVLYKLPMCFCLNSAISLALTMVQNFEIRAIGLRWNNLFKTGLPGDPMSVGVILLLMLLSSVMSILICLYFEQIRPGDYGVARPWYFPFTVSFWCPSRERNRESAGGLDEEHAEDGKSQRNPATFEPEPQQKLAVVQAQELRKVFDGREAVKNFSLNFFEDEITVLLGHNGAGKTTTFMMLTGMYQPTSGRAIINGYDMAVASNMARKSLSLCPQHNVLFGNLSVRHHIMFYSRLKGLNRDEIEAEIDNYLQRLDLTDKAKTPAKSLSGGMKRKLSLCCALCGRTKVVFCDEPSAGLDPSARRDLWNLIQSEKAGRCIVLTTHYMDEAEVLADRIVIMSDGEVHGYGTTSFLLQSVGSGYRLVCVTLEGCDVDAVTTFLGTYIRNIKPESKVGADLTFRLPTSEAHKFGIIFQRLEEKQEELKLDGFGINACTLADVFMQVGAENNNKQELSDNDEKGWKSHENLLGNDEKEQRSSYICMNHWKAMLHKKYICTYRHKLLYGLIILLPLIVYLLSLLLKLVSSNTPNDAPLEMNFAPYSKGLALLDLQSNDKEAKSIAKQYEASVKTFGGNFQSTNGKAFSDYLLHKSSADQPEIDRTFVAAATIRDGAITAWLNWYMFHTAPLTLNLVYNALGKAFIDPDMQIVITNKPRPDTNIATLAQQIDTSSSQNSLILFVYLCLATALFIMIPVSERALKVKAQQFISGISPLTYWLSHLVWDMGIFILIILVLVIVFHDKSIQTLGNMIIFLLIFAWAALPFTYLASWVFQDAPAAIIYIFNLNILFALLLTIFIEMLKKRETIFEYIVMLYPHYSMTRGVSRLFSYSDETETCKDLDEEIVCKRTGKCCPQPAIWGWTEVYFLLFTGFLYLMILLSSRYLRRLGYWLKKFQPKTGIWRPVPRNIDEDDDVRKAREKVQEMSEDEIKEHTIVLDDVIKRYNKFIAVRGISLYITAGECFGLLGLNGAGKSSTFNMIVGQHMITSGHIYVKGYSMKTEITKCFQHIGYCPQADALFAFMTGREHLKIFCLLNNIHQSKINDVIEHLGKYFQFTKHLDKQTHTYSGGTKRKLSAAMSSIGQSLVCLDEPTAGIDPGATREMWAVLGRIRDTGKSLLLTSHSMEECEALCTRLGIMIKGEFLCMGSLQYLKNKFNKGIVVKIKVGTEEEYLKVQRSNRQQPSQSNSSANESDEQSENDKKLEKTKPSFSSTDEATKANKGEENMNFTDSYELLIDNIAKSFEGKFPNVIILERYDYRGMIALRIPDKDIKWSEIFTYVESSRRKSQILYYTVTQTTLEQIFLDFAKGNVD